MEKNYVHVRQKNKEPEKDVNPKSTNVKGETNGVI